MLVIKSLLIFVEILVSLLIIVLVLIQKSKSEGLGMAFGSGMGETLFGSRAGNILTKLTIIFVAIFLGNTLFLGKVYSNTKDNSLMKKALETHTVPPVSESSPAPDAASSVLEGDGVSTPVELLETKSSESLPEQGALTPEPAEDLSTGDAELLVMPNMEEGEAELSSEAPDPSAEVSLPGEGEK